MVTTPYLKYLRNSSTGADSKRKDTIYKKGEGKMAESKDLLQVLWSGADVLRGKMDANEYKTYLLGLVFHGMANKNSGYKVGVSFFALKLDLI